MAWSGLAHGEGWNNLIEQGGFGGRQRVSPIAATTGRMKRFRSCAHRAGFEARGGSSDGSAVAISSRGSWSNGCAGVSCSVRRDRHRVTRHRISAKAPASGGDAERDGVPLPSKLILVVVQAGGRSLARDAHAARNARRVGDTGQLAASIAEEVNQPNHKDIHGTRRSLRQAQ